MKKAVLKSLFFVPAMLLGGFVCAQNNQSATAANQEALLNKNYQLQQVVDPAVQAKHLETATQQEQSQPVVLSTSTITEVDYSRLQKMTEAERKEIIGNPKKYKVINQPK